MELKTTISIIKYNIDNITGLITEKYWKDFVKDQYSNKTLQESVFSDIFDEVDYYEGGHAYIVKAHLVENNTYCISGDNGLKEFSLFEVIQLSIKST